MTTAPICPSGGPATAGTPDDIVAFHDSIDACLWLHHTPGLGALRIARLCEFFGTAGAALRAQSESWKEAGVSARHHPERQDTATRDAIAKGIDRDLAWRDSDTNHTIIASADPRFPALLRTLPDPPPVLYTVGDASLLARGQVAIVGSRSATVPGLRHSRRFARELAEAGVVITSGLALGIDGEAHSGALDAPLGLTIAVMATGPDRIYPARHRRLAHRIADHGLLVALWPVGTPSRAGHFPARNRVISGLALGTLVVEASIPSGTLVTARLAMEQGRQVYAIPGAIDNPVARGCHRLIRDGAMLVESPDEILEDLADWLGVGTTNTEPVTDRSADSNQSLNSSQAGTANRGAVGTRDAHQTIQPQSPNIGNSTRLIGAEDSHDVSKDRYPQRGDRPIDPTSENVRTEHAPTDTPTRPSYRPIPHQTSNHAHGPSSGMSKHRGPQRPGDTWPEASPEARWLLDRLGDSPIHYDELAAAIENDAAAEFEAAPVARTDRTTSIAPPTLARLPAALARLELMGAITRTEDGRIQRLPSEHRSC